MTLVIIFCIISYLVGSLPFGLWIGMLWKGVDIRTLGSKNIGATNVLRVLGPGPGITVFVLDTLKGVFGVLLARIVWPMLPDLHTHLRDLTMPYLVAIGICAILGHTFSAFLRFRGGKGVATSFGALLALSPPVGIIGFLTWAAMLLITRYVSVASLTASYSLPFAAHFTLDGIDRIWMLWLGVVLSVLVTIKHRGNIQRLLNGTESKIGERVNATEEAKAQ